MIKLTSLWKWESGSPLYDISSALAPFLISGRSDIVSRTEIVLNGAESVLVMLDTNWNLFKKYSEFYFLIFIEVICHVQSKRYPKIIMLTLHGTHCIHTLMNVRKIKFISYIHALFLHHFYSLFVKFYCKICKLDGKKVINQYVWLINGHFD